MAYFRQRDFLFCEMCGTMLSFDSSKDDNLHAIAYKYCWKSCYTTTTEDIERELGISLFDDFKIEKERKQMDYNANVKLVSTWTRSADGGQTIFYTCLKCGSKQTEDS